MAESLGEEDNFANLPFMVSPDVDDPTLGDPLRGLFVAKAFECLDATGSPYLSSEDIRQIADVFRRSEGEVAATSYIVSNIVGDEQEEIRNDLVQMGVLDGTEGL